MNDVKFQKALFFFNSLVPALMLAFDWWRDRLGANPVEAVTRTTGVLTLIFLTITLCVSPAAKLFKWGWLMKHRRLLGLYAFFYGAVHFITYVGFDRDWELQTVPADVWKRPFIAIGMVCFALMIPLAVTSTNAMIKRLGGKRWRNLHRLTYLIIIGGVVHYWMIVKSDITYPLAFAVTTSVLLGFRVIRARNA